MPEKEISLIRNYRMIRIIVCLLLASWNGIAREWADRPASLALNITLNSGGLELNFGNREPRDILQWTDDLGPPVWWRAESELFQIGSKVLLQPTELRRFYRLRREYVLWNGEGLNVADFGLALHKEVAVQRAIDAAVRNSVYQVIVPSEFLGYNPSSIRFNSEVHMVREAHLTAAKDVLAYGALGEEGHDDTAGIRAAIEAVGKLGERTVYFPARVYTISDEIRIDRSDIRLEGNGATIRQTTPGKKVIWSYGQEGLDIDGLQIEGTLNGKVFQAHAVYFENCIRTRIRNCTIDNAEQDAIKIKADTRASFDHRIEDCKILDYGGFGILVGSEIGYPENTVSNVTIRNVLIDKRSAVAYDASLAGHGIYLTDYVENVTISNCVLKAVQTQGIQIEGGRGHQVVNCRIEGKTPGGTTGSGITCSGSFCTFSDNRIDGFNQGGGAGVRFAKASTCRLSNSRISGSASFDVVLLDSHDVVVENCIMGDAYLEAGVRVRWDRNQVEGPGNMLRLVNCLNTRITQGNIKKMRYVGIRAEGCQDLLVEKVGIYDNGTAATEGRGIGVYLTNSEIGPSTDCRITGCSIEDSGAGWQAIAYIDEGLRNVFEDNRYSGRVVIKAATIE